MAVHELGLHTQFIGEIRDVKVDESLLDAAGGIDVARLSPILWVMGQNGYHVIGDLVGRAYSIGKTLVEGTDAH